MSGKNKTTFSSRMELRIPEDENQKVWRYIDFTKYVSLLESSSLHFTRIDKMCDTLEGCSPKANLDYVVSLADNPELNDSAELDKFVYNFMRNFRTQFFICCFHLRNNESATMWDIYAKKQTGIAIQTTYKRLEDCFRSDSGQDIYISMVDYLDYHSVDLENLIDIHSSILFKDIRHEDERELRAFTEIVTESNKVIIPQFDEGLNIPVDLEILIEKVYVSPDAPKWFFDLVKSVSKKYGLQKDVEKSKVNVDPYDEYPFFKEMRPKLD